MLKRTTTSGPLRKTQIGVVEEASGVLYRDKQPSLRQTVVTEAGLRKTTLTDPRARSALTEGSLWPSDEARTFMHALMKKLGVSIDQFSGPTWNEAGMTHFRVSVENPHGPGSFQLTLEPHHSEWKRSGGMMANEKTTPSKFKWRISWLSAFGADEWGAGSAYHTAGESGGWASYSDGVDKTYAKIVAAMKKATPHLHMREGGKDLAKAVGRLQKAVHDAKMDAARKALTEIENLLGTLKPHAGM